MQIRWNLSLTGEAYVSTQAWRQAKLDRCPLHPRGGCSLARHGTYVRKTWWGNAHIARWYCREAHTSFSLLPDCFAARLPGTLNDLEEAVLVAERAPDLTTAARWARHGRMIEPAGARRWLSRRLRMVKLCLTTVISLAPDVFAGCPPVVSTMRARLDTQILLMALRGQCSDQLAFLPVPLGFRLPDCPVTDRTLAFQHKVGPDPPRAMG